MSQKYYILADNQAITRAGLNFIIRELHLSERIIHIYSKQELPDLLKKNSQAIIILDYTLFDFSRIEELINLHERFPSVRWILFSEELTTEFIRNIYSDKAFSVLFKNSSFQEISIRFPINNICVPNQKINCKIIQNKESSDNLY